MTARIEQVADAIFEATADVVIVGAGAAGLVAALAASEAGASVVVLERDAIPRGSTALSAGLIPAAGTTFQAALGIDDDPARFRADILAKSRGLSDPTVLDLAVINSAPILDWLGRDHGLAFDVITDFRYPGHAVPRMHGLARRAGHELVDALRAAVETAQVPILTGAVAHTLVWDGRCILGVRFDRAGVSDAIGCGGLVLACNGYGGNRDLVATYLPDLNGAVWFGHDGNRGEAVQWGAALGAELRHMSGHQGHGSVAHPHGILITWATMTEGGFQVNHRGLRFSDESQGYSEQGALVMQQHGGVAWSIFDERIAAIAMQFDDFRQANAQGAIVRAETIDALAERIGVPAAGLAKSFSEVEAGKRGLRRDAYGRAFPGVPQPLLAPYCAVKVTGALFHTQGGLGIDEQARVRLESGGVIDNLYAAGGAAVGVSGPHASGYLSGNGLLTAVTLGRVAGQNAARRISDGHRRSAADSIRP